MAAHSTDIIAVAQQYLQWDSPQSSTRNTVETLVQAQDVAELNKLFASRMQFGTAGLRARMGPGYSQMNDLTIVQTTQGLAAYLQDILPADAKRAVVIGYDGRHNSRRFAELTAAVFLSKNFTVHLFSRLTATPLVPFSVLNLPDCKAGIMITASHNPKQDNGYKLYAENGSQIIPPVDAYVAKAIEHNLQPWISMDEYSTLIAQHIQHMLQSPESSLLLDPTAAMTELYMSHAEKLYSWTKDVNASAQVRVCYTAMHGVGKYWTELAFQRFGLPPFIQVKEQVEPDPEFSTVAFPNPEEGKGSLALAIQTAQANSCPLILANDPDADRLAIAEFDASKGEYRIFNGNEIACLLSDWTWKNFKRNHPDESTENWYMLASTVSSKYLQSMANKEGFKFVDTLTGFKWMGNKAAELVHQGKKFLFAYEVEIGFLVGDMSYDKDGVRTAAIVTEMCNSLYRQGKTLLSHLQELYHRYGHFVMNTSYFFCHDSAIMNRVFSNLRHGGADGGYLKTCGDIKVTHIRDITTGYDSRESDGKSRLPTTPDSQMITYWFENGATATLRNSGTEPKLKYYVEASDMESADKAKAIVDHTLHNIISEFLKPEVNGLIAAKRD